MIILSAISQNPENISPTLAPVRVLSNSMVRVNTDDSSQALGILLFDFHFLKEDP